MSSSSSSKKQKQQQKSSNKKKYTNKTYRRSDPQSQSAIRHGSGSEVASSQAKVPSSHFSENPLEWDDSHRNFEADCEASSISVLEYMRGTYHTADRLTVSRAIGNSRRSRSPTCDQDDSGRLRSNACGLTD
jgi:hypothetical protein